MDSVSHQTQCDLALSDQEESYEADTELEPSPCLKTLLRETGAVINSSSSSLVLEGGDKELSVPKLKETSKSSKRREESPSGSLRSG